MRDELLRSCVSKNVINECTKRNFVRKFDQKILSTNTVKKLHFDVIFDLKLFFKSF